MLKKLVFVSTICCFALVLSCKNNSKEKPTPESSIPLENILPYKVFEEKIIENDESKLLSIVLLLDENDTINKGHIDEFVSKSLDYYIDKYAFNNSFESNQIRLFVYTSREKANSGMGQWIAKVNFNSKKLQEKVIIDDTQLVALTEKKVEKWGLSYAERQTIWSEIIKAEDQARIASKNLRISKKNLTVEELESRIEDEEVFKKYYKKEIIEKYSIDLAILDSISKEAMNNGWSF